MIHSLQKKKQIKGSKNTDKSGVVAHAYNLNTGQLGHEIAVSLKTPWDTPQVPVNLSYSMRLYLNSKIRIKLFKTCEEERRLV